MADTEVQAEAEDNTKLMSVVNIKKMTEDEARQELDRINAIFKDRAILISMLVDGCCQKVI